MRRIIVVIICLICVASNVGAAPNFPKFTSNVVDEAGILNAGNQQNINAKIDAFEKATGIQIAVATVSSLEGYEIREYGYRLARKWQLGQQDVNNGVLLLVAPHERKVSIEVGYGLEGELTDALSFVIIEEYIIPKFKRDKISSGVEKGVELIIKSLKGDYKNKKLSQKIDVWKGIRLTSILFLLVIFSLLTVLFEEYLIGKVISHARKRANLQPDERVELKFRDHSLISLIKIAAQIIKILFMILVGGKGKSKRGGGGSFGGGGASAKW